MTQDQKLREYLKRVTIDLHEARAQLRDVQSSSREPVAIVGMSCRFPGGASSPQALWEMVHEGRDAVCGFPRDRGWDVDRLYDPDPEHSGTTYVREAGFLYEATCFDADFFSISPREALAMSPQQRLSLEAAWEAIEDAGIDPVTLHSSSTGVFVGAAADRYEFGMVGAPEGADGFVGTGSLTSVVSGRIAYVLGLVGPALTVDTACSSSLVALHLACASLRAGECSLAVAGGVGVASMPDVFVEFARQRGLAPDGRCKSFAEAADGTNWAEGVGLLLLERLSDAQRLGHRVLALVRGSAVNQDGASNGLTAPNGPSQRRVIAAALASAGLLPGDVDAVEGHGTGTTLGDPIEIQALLGTYGQDRSPERPLWLGSIKSNMGHAQAAAGVAGLIKMVLALEHETLPRTLHVDRPTSKVKWSAGAVSLLAEPRPWPRGERPRRAGISSFGVSGTNAHVILEEAPPLGASERRPRSDAREDRVGLLAPDACPLLLSARSDAALREQGARISAFIEREEAVAISDVGVSLAARTPFDRRAVAVGDRTQALAGLDALAADLPAVGLVRGVVGSSAKGIAFVFPGQGSQWAGMAVELIERSPLFAGRLGECGEALRPLTGWSLLDVLRGADGAPSLERVDVVQPALFGVMIALAELWRACGVRPDAVLGHSQGEIAAACVAGALSLEDAARVVALRSRALVSLAGIGGMVSLAADAAQVERLVESFEGRLSLAAVNGPGSAVVSGELDALDQLLERCRADGVKARKIPVDYAAHSAHVEQIEKELLDGCAGIAPRSAEVPFYSAVAGGALDGAQLDADYWYRNLRETVDFEQAARAALESGCCTFVEVSPHPVLAVALHEIADAVSTQATVLGSLRRDDGGAQRMLVSLSEAWAHGAPVDWGRLFEESEASPLRLPTYAFQRRHHWPENPMGWLASFGAPGVTPVGHPLLNVATELADEQGWLFNGSMSVQSQPWLADHVLAGMVLVPGTTYVDCALSAGAKIGCELLEELIHEAPLVLASDEAVQLQVSIGAADESGRLTVSIYSRLEGSEQDRFEEQHGWTRHARGLLVPRASASASHASERSSESAAFAAGPWPPSGAEPLSRDDLYDYFAGLGLDYGPTFFAVQRAWVRGEEVFTEVCLPEQEHGRARSFAMHPALLDTAMQGSGAYGRALGGAGKQRMLPFAWTGVSISQPGVCAVRVRISRAPEDKIAMLAADEQGRPVAAVESFVLREVAEEQLSAMRAGKRNDSLLALKWAPPPAVQAETPERGRNWLMLDGLSALSDLDSTLEAIAAGARVPAWVLVPLGASGTDQANGEPASGAHETLELCLEFLQRWLAEPRLLGARLMLVTSGAVSTAAEDPVSDLVGAAVWGLLRAAQSEHPGRLALVDGEVSAEQVEALLALAGEEPQIAVRAGEPLVARLERASTAAGEPWDGLRDDSRVEGQEGSTRALDELGRTSSGECGTVLITGGTGMLASLVAKHLVANHRVRSLLLVSRRGPQAPEVSRLQAELEGLGAEVDIAACDVSERAQLERLLAEVPDERPLSAVVHTAGTLDDGLIDSMTADQLHGVLSAKVDGAWQLHELTRELPLSAFILFSSSAATLGAPGQGNYAAANAFLDGLASYRRAQGLPGMSLGWGWWGGLEGLAAELDAVNRVRLQRTGAAQLSPEEGLDLLEQAHALGKPMLVPARLDRAVLSAQARRGMLPPLLRGLVPVPTTAPASGTSDALVRRLASTPESDRRRVVLELVRAEVATVLGHPSATAVDVRSPFKELGFDSLTAIELRNRLASASGVALPATLVFDYPSTEALADFLLDRVGARVDGHGGAPAEEDVQEAIASIPLARLREAGVLERLMQLAGLREEGGSQGDDEQAPERIDEMDVESLVRMSLGEEGSTDELGVSR